MSSTSSSISEVIKVPLNLPGSDFLVGRNKEHALLSEAYLRVRAASSERVLVTGESGSGKSSLIRQLEQSVDKNTDFFVSGKHNQFEKCSTAFGNAMTELCHFLQERKDIQQCVKEALSLDEILTLKKYIPAFGFVVNDDRVAGEEHAATITTEHSFQCSKLALRTFLNAVTSKATLVLFLDDYQWADEASQEVLKFILSDGKSRNLLLLVASREKDVGMLDDNTTWPSSTISLGSLSKDSINDIVSTVLQQRAEVTVELSSVIYNKTGGNPHYCLEFLETLHRRGLLTFDFARGRWGWNVSEIISSTNVSSNVVDLLMDKIQSLSLELQVTLMTAACLGFTFDSQVLQEILVTKGFFEVVLDTVSKDSEESKVKDPSLQLDRVLDKAVKAGLVETSLHESSSRNKFKFSHDRVQQCTFDMFPSVLYEKLGLIVFEISQSGKAEEWMVYTSVDLLTNATITFNEDNGYARLCLDAAKRASKRGAYISAANYADKGLESLTWKNNYDLHLELSNLSADMRYAYGDFERSSKVVSHILENAHCVTDKLRAFTVHVATLGAHQDLTGAILAATKFLKEIGVCIPKKANVIQVGLAVSKTKRMLNGRKPHDFKDLPRLTDPTIIEAMRLLNRLAVYDWRSGETNLLVIHGMTMMQLTLTHGMSPFGPVATALYGSILAHTGNLQEAYEWGNLTLELAKDPRAREGYANAIKIAHLCLYHLKMPLFGSLDAMLSSFQIAKGVGDIEIAAYCLQGHGMFSVVVGMPLENLEHQMQSYVEFCCQFHQEAVMMEILPFYQLTLNLLGKSEDPLVLSGEAMVEQDFVDHVVCSNEGVGSILLLRYARIFLLYILNELELAESERLKLDPRIDFVSTYFMKYLNYFFCGMTSLGMARKGKSIRKHVKNATFYMKKLEDIAKAGSPNFIPMLKLLNAEKQALKGADAMQCYDSAISMASRSGFRLITAISCEQAGIYMLEKGDSALAIEYLQRSWDEFMAYGAKSKLSQMKEKHKSTIEFHERSAAISSKTSSRLQPHLVKTWEQQVRRG